MLYKTLGVIKETMKEEKKYKEYKKYKFNFH